MAFNTQGLFNKLKALIPSNKLIASSQKIKPYTSLVFLVKNNQKLLEHALKQLIHSKVKYDELIVLDFNSIDNSLEVAKQILNGLPNVKIDAVEETSMVTDDIYKTIKNHSQGDVLQIIDLYAIGIKNPNVYVPDIFNPLNYDVGKEITKVDTRIDGTKLLDFNILEREKNSVVIKEQIIELLSNVRMEIETLQKKMPSISDDDKQEFSDLIDYLDKAINNTLLLSRLIGKISYQSDKLNNNLLTAFKDYGESHNVSIKYKVMGSEVDLKASINTLVLNITQEILYTTVQHNLVKEMLVIALHENKSFRLVFKFNSDQYKGSYLNPESGLHFYVLQSIKNRLRLIGGKLIVKVNHSGSVKIIIEIPCNDMTCMQKGES